MNTDLTKQSIPSGWKQTTLGNLVSITTGSRDANHGSLDGQYPFFTCAQRVYKIDNFSFDTEAVLIAGNGDFNVKYYKGKFDAYQRTYILSDFQNTTGPFIYQKIKQALNDIIRNNQGSSVKFIKIGDLFDYKFILPPIEEQQKIAEILEAVDDDINKIQEVIKSTEKLKRGLMQQLFTRGIGHIKFKKTKIGEIPDSWKVLPLSKVSDIIDSLHRTPVFSDSGFAMVRVTDIKDGFLNLDKAYRVSKDIYRQFVSNYVPKLNDIVLSRVGSYGISSYVNTDEKFCIGQNTVVIHCHTEPKYIFYALNSQLIKKAIENEVAGSGYKSLSLKSIRDLQIPMPEKEEQREIANILSVIDEKILVNKKSKEKLILLKNGLMQDLLSGEVRAII